MRHQRKRGKVAVTSPGDWLSFIFWSLIIMSARTRTVYQYHYTAWPDHGVPLHALPLITFVRNSAAANPDNDSPIVVHCR